MENLFHLKLSFARWDVTKCFDEKWVKITNCSIEVFYVRGSAQSGALDVDVNSMNRANNLALQFQRQCQCLATFFACAFVFVLVRWFLLCFRACRSFGFRLSSCLRSDVDFFFVFNLIAGTGG